MVALSCIALGVAFIVYSGTLVTVGIGVVDSQWSLREGMQVSLSVNSTNRTDEFADESIGCQATSFDTGGHHVSLMIMTSINDTIITYTNVTGTEIADFAYVPDEDEYVHNSFTFRVSWAGENATLHFLYSGSEWSHADGPIYHPKPGFEETMMVGWGLFAIGAVVYVGLVVRAIITAFQPSPKGQ